MKLICIEVTTIEEAVKAAEAGTDIIQISNQEPEIVEEIINTIRKQYPNTIIAVYGDIDENNITKYIKTRPNIIITTTPYYSKPIKTETKIRRL